MNKNKLKHKLNLRNDEELKKALSGLEEAAREELFSFLSSEIVPANIRDFRVNRLYFLITHYYRNRFPSESEVARIFGIQTSAASGLLRSVQDKYGYELQQLANSQLKKILESAGPVPEKDDEFTIDSEIKEFIRRLNDLLFSLDRELEPIRKINNSSNIYRISKRSRDRLLKELSS